MFETGKSKILIVEDDPNVQNLYQEVFEKAGFVVTIIPDADGFFADKVAETQPDIISMDLVSGKGGHPVERDGFDAMQVLRSDLRTVDIPIIVSSNFFQEDRVRKAKELGAKDYINETGYSIDKIPEQYIKYLEDPKGYKPLHPIFREE